MNPCADIGMVKVCLHGALRSQFGKEIEIGARTPAQAIRVLMVMRPGFREAVEHGQYKVVRGSLREGMALDPAGLHLLFPPQGARLHLIPRAAGAKRGGGAGKMILGAALIAGSLLLLQPEIAGPLALGVGEAGPVALGLGTPILGGATSIGGLMFSGGLLFLGGLVSALSPTPKPVNASFLLSGSENVVEQGAAIPVIYGRIRVGSVVASIGYEAAAYSPPASIAYPANADAAIGAEVTATGGSSGAVDPITSAGGFAGPSGTGGGGGGGKGGGGGGGNEAPNTLQSAAYVRIIDILGEGPIGGLCDGPKSIFFNNTPLMAEDGHWNFRGVTWAIRYGLPDQDPVPGFPAAETSNAVGVRVTNAAGPIVRTFTSSTANAARVTVRIPALFKQDTNSGNMENGPTVNLTVEVRPASGAWKTVVNDYIAGKCTSPYQRSYRFDLPTSAGSSWDVRITRTTSDFATQATIQAESWWDLCDMISDFRMVYPDTAYIAISFDSRSFGTSLPSRQYEVFGREIAVPANYNPVTRRYASAGTGTSGGTWNAATMQTAVSNNPAWVAYDMVAHPRYGMGIAASLLAVTRAELYIVGQWCDEWLEDGFDSVPVSGCTVGQAGDLTLVAVPGLAALKIVAGTYVTGSGIVAGTVIITVNNANSLIAISPAATSGGSGVTVTLGGKEPRWTANGIIAQQADAYRVLQALVGVFRGMSWWGAGAVQFTADMPVAPVKLANQTNVLDGDFRYSNASFKTRHTMAFVAWKNPNLGYGADSEAVDYPPALAQRGAVTTQIVAAMTTSRGQARRMGKWLLYTENEEFTATQFKGGRDFIDLRPGDIVKIADPNRAGARMGGRLRSGSTRSSLNLDTVFPAPSIDGATAGADFTIAEYESWDSGVGGSFLITVAMQDGTLSDDLAIDSLTLSGDGTYTIASMATHNLPSDPSETDRYIITSPIVAPRLMRTLGVREADGHFEIAGMLHDPNKWAWVEQGVRFASPSYSALPAMLTTAIPAPTSCDAAAYIAGVGTTTKVVVTLSLQTPSDPRIQSHAFRVVGANFFQIYPTPSLSMDAGDIPPGTYTISACNVGFNSQTGPWVTRASSLVITGLGDAPAAPTTMSVTGGSRAILITWPASPQRDVDHADIWRLIAAPGAAPGANPAVVTGAAHLSNVAATAYTDTSSALLNPGTTAHYWVRYITTTGVAGAWQGPIYATTTTLAAADIAGAVLLTAAYAAGLNPPIIIATTATAGTYANQLATVTADHKLYRWDGSAWQPVVNTADIAGTISGPQIAANAVDFTKLATTLNAPVFIANSGVSVGSYANGQLATSVADGKLYKVASGAWVAVVSATDLSGQIVNSQITVGTITGDRVVAGTLTGGLIAAGAITASKMKIGGANLIPDPGFADPACWTLGATSAGWYLDVGGGVPATLGINPCAALYDGYFTGTAEKYFFLINSAAQNSVIPAIAGTVYTLTATAFNSGNKNIQAGVSFYNSSGAYISSTSIVWLAYSAGATKQVQMTAPAGTATMGAWGHVDAGAAWSGRAGMGGFNVVQAATGALIVDGAITATHIAALAINAGHLQVDSVDAAQIKAGAVGATEIHALAISGGHLAADFALFNSAQIGDGLIINAKIGSLAVDTIKVASGALSYFAAAYNEYLWTPPSTYGSDGSCTLTITVADANEMVLIMFKEVHEFTDHASGVVTGGTGGAGSGGYSSELGGPG